ncbi:hypothetical protein BK126_06845 [Paenibacillus sp. FSL H7-0326]|uniref:hypothetical protein n=1 Tax=Paenibacillus sp. FSL H7-0326 TaxID=1921144 RepID=UPI00096FC36E|nr:hypothetical protein [Paenibacillus sp. FSL H7-0326]OMC71766.1 hypothetical protein BK126_06845 [Paenibacillus sp. FSL H7-0326]
MNKRRNVILVCCAIIIFIFIYNYYNLNYTNESITSNVINQDGYSLTLQVEQIPIEIFIKPEWITFNPEERKEQDIELLETYNTNLLLDDVWNRGNDIYFSFKTTFNMKYKAGEFIYNGFFNDDGTFTTPSAKVRLYDINMKEFSVGQTGTGPEASFSFGIRPEEQELISEGFYVKYDGYNLYAYSKR